ncbi:BppU family phage baseplate upper protein [Enterococcus hulanensis]|uniref:BppU family phage baseplate upper protein n=1 Tax=Enterococcus hulanensis TaxID=2559929 RepID=UPI00288C9460|nr:BppU family phage baseplate upper protein [Enterococcus hulanensis]MDT2660708.1 BppU family phage baseplate upper protein [Enterococcus hulanensis]
MAHKVLNLDLSKEPSGNPFVYGRVGDSDSQTVTVNVTNKLNKQDLSEYTIAFEGETCGGKTKVIDSENVVSTPEGLKQGTFDYIFPNKAFAVAGEYKRAYFSFVSGDSRDTTGDFKLVVLKNADLTAEEAETVISEYNKLVEELRELQKIAIDEMDQNFTAAQERIAELEVQITQALEAFESGNFWTKEESFNKEQSSANVIFQLLGKDEAEISFMTDFKGKVTGSVVNNPNIIRFSTNSILMTPFAGSEPAQIYYDRAMKKDGEVLNVGTTNTGYISQIQPNFDLVKTIEKNIPELFELLKLESNADKVEFIKNNLSKLKVHVDGIGVGMRRNRLTLKMYDSKGVLEADEAVNAHYCGPFVDQITELTKRVSALDGQ